MTYQSQLPPTVDEGLNTQTEQLNEWKILLKPKIFKELCRLIEQKNKEGNYKNGYDVFRGTNIDNLVHNHFVHEPRNKKIELAQQRKIFE